MCASCCTTYYNNIGNTTTILKFAYWKSQRNNLTEYKREKLLFVTVAKSLLFVITIIIVKECRRKFDLRTSMELLAFLGAN